MKGIYSSPLRVYMIMALLAVLGIYSGLNLPVSLYPNSSKPTIWCQVGFGSLNTTEFLDSYGKNIEYQLKTIESEGLKVEKLKADYSQTQVYYQVEFGWGSDPKKAKSEVTNILNALSAAWPKEIRESLWVNYWSNSSGFVAISFFSDKRTMDELYDILDPVITPKISKIKDADEMTLWNPNMKEVRIILNPDVVSSLGIFPKNIENLIYQSLIGKTGGSITVGQNSYSVQTPRSIQDVLDLKNLLIPLGDKKMIHLSEVATIEYGPIEDQAQIRKTNGATSLILYGSPRAGGNVKKLAEDVTQIVEESMQELPSDIQYRSLVDPSHFIRQSIENVVHEVLIAALLAVIVLFLFVGSISNTITAAIEIPLSMIMAFIVMKMTGMNLNLISLGGFALAAGMNVDGSIVVLENIFRHMDISKPKNFDDRLKVIVSAVNEVKLPIIASTISTLVVFAPLALTKDLTNAILGDLAKAIVFSHTLSMIIALILVPTIRLQLLSRKNQPVVLPPAPLQGVMKFLENLQKSILNKLISHKKAGMSVIIFFVVAVAIVGVWVVPTLRREIIGKPDTDWMILSLSTHGNSMVKAMEEITDQEEFKLLKEMGDYISYTFVQIRSPNRSTIMARLKDKSDMKVVWEKMEAKFQNTPDLFFWIGPWNPAELPLPDPPHALLEIKGGNLDDQKALAEDLIFQMQQKDFFPRVWSEPAVSHNENIEIIPNQATWHNLSSENMLFTFDDLIDLSRVATTGKKINTMTIDGKTAEVFLKYPSQFFDSKEKLESYPIRINEKIVPFKALAEVSIVNSSLEIYREDAREVIKVYARQDTGKEHLIEKSQKDLKSFLKEYSKQDHAHLDLKSKPSIVVMDESIELTNALNQLGLSVALSLLLIFFTLLMQFGGVVHSLIIMVAIPSGILGGCLSLYLFNSTLSLNSVLGIILLNGIAVNNSIILVDFIIKLFKAGLSPKEAVLVAARKRLKPILITSLTTILGMLPVAIGLGEGGKILQPLGIAVTNGLWVSTVFTIFLVPLLECMYLSWKVKMSFDQKVVPEEKESANLGLAEVSL